jgi:hypothetical protein
MRKVLQLLPLRADTERSTRFSPANSTQLTQGGSVDPSLKPPVGVTEFEAAAEAVNSEFDSLKPPVGGEFADSLKPPVGSDFSEEAN